MLQANLAAFRDMAAGQGRRGWQDDIRRDTARLQAITERLRILNNYSDNQTHIPWLNRVTQAGVVAVAVLFQIAAVLAVWSLSGGRKTSKPFRSEPIHRSERDSVSRNLSRNISAVVGQAKASEQEFYGALWGHIEAHARSNSARLAKGNGKITQAALAHDLGVKAPDFSAIKLLGQGEQVPRNPSRDSVETLAARFGISMPK